MTIIHETDVPEVEQPGRQMRWLADEKSLNADKMSVCVIRVAPGETVRPAHSHPKSEELIYIITGTGKVMIEGEVGEVRPGSAILFEQGKIHMLRNTGDEEMKVICFFAPATSVDNYKTFEDITFPE
ncbi:cupin domain-containing protein [Aliifodinibius sp. S!AR15-10]|uniref:cupin domain-containing protein n=1 Tax=Aliifodinibius sp. S!AR15-10 TaxID=2950437 RepID=UPI00285F30A6|nr:cupin domain-containing protein [Aliifodinibius sp. S!AR15-10]MDR8394094.1 cupin domain-containing protein [Aliifodinibius sp. S!AR15-10]